jgi:hypothetical protein
VAATKHEMFSLPCGKKNVHHAAEKLIFLGEHLGLWEQMNFGDITECTSGNK